MQKYQYIPLDSILAKFGRDFRGLDVNEIDAIEWIAEALGFIKNVSTSEHKVFFLEVKNYHVDLPIGLHYITQIARNNQWQQSKEDINCCLISTASFLAEEDTTLLSQCQEVIRQTEDCHGNLSCQDEPVYYRPLLDLQYEYTDWLYSRTRKALYTPVRLSNHSFFDTLVCKEPQMENLYHESNCKDEYTIVGNQIRFSFQSGFVAVAFTRSFLDEKTGYPLIPDDEAARAAITYYLTWKFKEREGYLHREGSLLLAREAEQRWLKYVKQFKNKTKMPRSLDEYINLMEQGRKLLFPTKAHYSFFGNLNVLDKSCFNSDKKGSFQGKHTSSDNKSNDDNISQNTIINNINNNWDVKQW